MRRGSLQNFLRRPRHERAAIVEATAWLGVARLALLVLAFRRLAAFLGEEGRETATGTIDDARARVVGQAVEAAARHAPWQGLCFAQALTATAMLRRRGLACTTYFGVARDGGRVAAHAWVRCGDRMVVGGEGHERYAVLATFAAPSRSGRPSTV